MAAAAATLLSRPTGNLLESLRLSSHSSFCPERNRLASSVKASAFSFPTNQHKIKSRSGPAGSTDPPTYIQKVKMSADFAFSPKRSAEKVRKFSRQNFAVFWMYALEFMPFSSLICSLTISISL